jgi:hypothetical protein
MSKYMGLNHMQMKINFKITYCSRRWLASKYAAVLGRVNNSNNSAYSGHEIGPPVTMTDVFPALMIMP